jgi:hypothetical protein
MRQTLPERLKILCIDVHLTEYRFQVASLSKEKLTRLKKNKPKKAAHSKEITKGSRKEN